MGPVRREERMGGLEEVKQRPRKRALRGIQPNRLKMRRVGDHMTSS